jgi:hypothetical protein
VRALTFRERLREEAAKAAAAEPVDPWRHTLERVRGKVDYFDRQERISSQTLLDLLEVPQRNRTAGTFRRLGSDGRTRLDRCAGARPDAGRLSGASAWVLPRTAQLASDFLNSVKRVAILGIDDIFSAARRTVLNQRN